MSVNSALCFLAALFYAHRAARAVRLKKYDRATGWALCAIIVTGVALWKP